jgi:hypothetical protein
MSPRAPGARSFDDRGGEARAELGQRGRRIGRDSEIFAGDRGRLALFVPSHVVVIMAPVRPGRG